MPIELPDMAAIARQTAQQQAAVNTLRLNIAGNVLGSVVAVDYANALRLKAEHEAKSEFDPDAKDAELQLHVGLCGQISLNAADHMLRMAGVI